MKDEQLKDYIDRIKHTPTLVNFVDYYKNEYGNDIFESCDKRQNRDVIAALCNNYLDFKSEKYQNMENLREDIIELAMTYEKDALNIINALSLRPLEIGTMYDGTPYIIPTGNEITQHMITNGEGQIQIMAEDQKIKCDFSHYPTEFKINMNNDIPTLVYNSKTNFNVKIDYNDNEINLNVIDYTHEPILSATYEDPENVKDMIETLSEIVKDNIDNTEKILQSVNKLGFDVPYFKENSRLDDLIKKYSDEVEKDEFDNEIINDDISK